MSNTHDGETENGAGKLADYLRDGSLPSRRAVLKGAAAVGGGSLVAAIGGSNRVLAHEAGDDDTSDVDVLNFALTLEHLEYAFYRDGLRRFDQGAFVSADILEGFSAHVRRDVRGNLADVRDHEKTHVDTLASVIEDLGGDPVGEACYEFGYGSPSEFLAIAAVLENTGVSAYDGAISLIENADLLTAGATIATVEARHASYLNFLNGDDPFPAAFDEPKSMDEILEAAGGFIVECDDDGSGGGPFRVAVDCDVSNRARVTITNVSDRRVQLRDIDNEGVNAVVGRPMLDPGESYTRDGVEHGTAVLAAFDRSSNTRMGTTRAEIDCE
ncbi:ferritin-like domain-containing protein [Salinirubellus sp. GCM10025818]|uniref:ferritin-like domain-containing protein n=1 Tax=Salinirubellus TaxID=2162630 RepID=UPI0030D02E9A